MVHPRAEAKGTLRTFHILGTKRWLLFWQKRTRNLVKKAFSTQMPCILRPWPYLPLAEIAGNRPSWDDQWTPLLDTRRGVHCRVPLSRSEPTSHENSLDFHHFPSFSMDFHSFPPHAEPKWCPKCVSEAAGSAAGSHPGPVGARWTRWRSSHEPLSGHKQRFYAMFIYFHAIF